MPKLAAQVAPQRSTQYAQLASELAAPELRLSPLGPHIQHIEPAILGGQEYLLIDLDQPLDEALLHDLGTLAMTSAHFEFFGQIGDVEGPLLRPLTPTFQPTLPPDILTARRYRGKTNEMLTQFMLNIARFSSAFAHRPWNTLRLYDPLAGGGTTLFAGLMLGMDVAGSDIDRQTIDGAAQFLQQYGKEQRIGCKVRSETLKNIGKRWWIEIKQGDITQRALLTRADVGDGEQALHGFKKPHLIVTDLPYGIQHNGELIALLEKALPVWVEVIDKGGAIAFSWDATRFPREEMIDLVKKVPGLIVLDDAPYNALTHQVDRVIKRRDILVAIRDESP